MTILNEAAPNTKPADPLYFNCNMCGECCSSWNIPIEGDKARALMEKDWVKARLKTMRRELIRVDDSLYRLPLTDENVCVFLADDKRCLIEVEEGPALKPTECQRFPFAGVRVQGEMQYDTSASCKQVAEKLLLAFEPILPRSDDSAVPILEKDFECLPNKIPAGGLRKTDYAGYVRYQAGLKEIFTREALTPEQALGQVRELLKSLHKKSLAASTDIPSQEKNRRSENWVPVLFLRKPYGAFSWTQLMQGKSYDDPRVFGMPIDLEDANKVQWPVTQDTLLKAFLFTLLNRKILLARGGSLENLLAMASVAAILVRWYARVLASLQDRSQVEAADVPMAIRLVERYYTGHQPRFLQFFRSQLNVRLLYLLGL